MKSSSAPFGACRGVEHLSRRTLLSTTWQGIGYSALSWLTPLSQKLAISAENSRQRPKSVIVLWMQGGISQLESFDPHPGSAISQGGQTIQTTVKGINFDVGLQQTAERMNDFSVIRSVVSDEGDHARAIYQVKTGYRPFPGLIHPSLGAIVCHQTRDLPGLSSRVDIPTHISILPDGFAGRGGYLGAKWDAFQMGDPVRRVPDIKTTTSAKRLQKRLSSLDVLEQSFRSGRLENLDQDRTHHRATLEDARHMMTSEQLAAFDVSNLPDSERLAYGDTPFGRSCLAALQLVEAGVRCVEVTLGGWDTHINNLEGQARQNAILDPAFASLIKGLKERDLYEDTIVLIGTEFGRTPKVNVADGRDHWPHAFSVAIGGGGLKGGLALGETDPTGQRKNPSKPVHITDIHATVLATLGVRHTREIVTPVGRPQAISDGIAIRELTG